MNSPTSYAEWTACLDHLHAENCDEEVLAAMEIGKLEWTSGVADRFVSRLIDTLDYRLKRTADLLTRDLGRYRGDPAHLVNAVLSARRRIAFLTRLAELPVLPDYVREQLTENVTAYAKSAQSAMEESAKQDRSGKILSLLRNNAISYLNPAQSLPGIDQVDEHLVARPRRTVILP